MPAAIVATLPTLKARTLSSSGSSSGERWRRELNTNRTSSTRGRDEAADHRPARPAPVVALDDAQGEQPEGEGEQRRPAEVRQRPAPRCPALDERAPGDDPGGDPEGKVDQERPAPVTDLDEQAADRRAEPGRQGGRGAPQADGVGPALRGERRDDQRQRGRHQHRRAEGLHDAGADEEGHRRRERADDRGDREDQDAPDERTPPADQVGEPAERDQERREDDVVGVEDPRQVADRGVRERLADARERDVDDRGVEEGQERPERGDRPGRCRSRPGRGSRLPRRGTPGARPRSCAPLLSARPRAARRATRWPRHLPGHRRRPRSHGARGGDLRPPVPDGP